MKSTEFHRPDQSVATRWPFVLICVYLLGAMLIFQRQGQQEFLTPQKMAYLAVFVATIFFFLNKHLDRGDLGRLLFKEKACQLILLLLVYYLIVNSSWAILNNIPLTKAIRPQLRLFNLLLVPVIFSELKTEQHLWDLYIFIFIILSAISILDILYIYGNVAGSIWNQRISDNELYSRLYNIVPCLAIPLIYYFRRKPFKLVMLLILTGILLLRSILSFERFFIVGIVLAISIFILASYFGRNRNRRFAKICLFFSIIFILFVGYLNFTTNVFQIYGERFQNLDLSLLNRSAEYTAAFKGFWHSPIFGQGMGADIDFVRQVPWNGGMHSMDHAEIHDIVLFHLFHGGLVGAAIYFSIWWFLLKTSWRLLFRIKMTEKEFVMVSGCVMAAVYIFCDSLVQTIFTGIDINFVLAVIIASIMALNHKYRLAKRQEAVASHQASLRLHYNPYATNFRTGNTFNSEENI
jgi:hypothetical protein